MNAAPTPLAFDEGDLIAIFRLGCRRADTHRLRTLIQATARRAEGILASRRAASEPIDELTVVFGWRRSGGRWRCILEASGPTDELHKRTLELARKHGTVAMTGIDAMQVVGGPAATAEAMASDVVRLWACDVPRRTLAHDVAAIVDVEGRLGDLVPACTAVWPAGGAS